jgi:hypothetical protein
LFDAGQEVVIIGHSYGGVPACAATQGQSVSERAAEGKKGGFRSIIYMAGFAIPERGKDLLQTFGGSWTPWQDPAVPYTKVSLGNGPSPLESVRGTNGDFIRAEPIDASE